MSRSNATNCAWAASMMILGIGLYSFYVRELVASMILFSVMFFSLGLAVLSVFSVWTAGKQVVVWARPVSRNAITLLRGFAWDERG